MFTLLALFIVCPMAWWSIAYDIGRTKEWPLPLKWAFILSILLLFTASTALDAQVVGNPDWCGTLEGWWYYAAGCFLPGM